MQLVRRMLENESELESVKYRTALNNTNEKLQLGFTWAKNGACFTHKFDLTGLDFTTPC